MTRGVLLSRIYRYGVQKCGTNTTYPLFARVHTQAVAPSPHHTFMLSLIGSEAKQTPS